MAGGEMSRAVIWRFFMGLVGLVGEVVVGVGWEGGEGGEEGEGWGGERRECSRSGIQPVPVQKSRIFRVWGGADEGVGEVVREGNERRVGRMEARCVTQASVSGLSG